LAVYLHRLVLIAGVISSGFLYTKVSLQYKKKGFVIILILALMYLSDNPDRLHRLGRYLENPLFYTHSFFLAFPLVLLFAKASGIWHGLSRRSLYLSWSILGLYLASSASGFDQTPIQVSLPLAFLVVIDVFQSKIPNLAKHLMVALAAGVFIIHTLLPLTSDLNRNQNHSLKQIFLN
jgi:hypothetical protein